MTNYELRDPDEARAYVLQSLWLARVVAPSETSIARALRWAFEIVSEGQPLPPLGFVSDVGHVALGSLRAVDQSTVSHDLIFEASLRRRYEDYVVGKLYADVTFERGSDALMRYQGRDRERCLAFLINQLRQRAAFGGVILSPSVIKTLLGQKTDKVLQAAWEATEEECVPELLPGVVELTNQVRNTGELLGSEDIFELEHGTALHGFGQRIALRQILQAADVLSDSLPHKRPPKSSRRHAIATRIVDEDTYPVGGFSSISNKGSIESLLHSQLAYIEPEDRPDLFDIKFLRDELLYYSRDDNQFLRQRRTFVFALYADLVEARVKDGELPWQRIILLLAVLYVVVQRLIEWLSDEALVFEFLFVEEAGRQLADERTLLETLFREQIENGTVIMDDISPGQLLERCRDHARRSQTQCSIVSAADRQLELDNALLNRLRIRSQSLEIAFDEEDFKTADDLSVAGWQQALANLLETWV